MMDTEVQSMKNLNPPPQQQYVANGTWKLKDLILCKN